MDLHKNVFTTFEAANICHANVTSIKNWIDQGKLNAFRTPGGHYRIPRRELDSFLHAHGMPNPLRHITRIVVAIAQDSLADPLIQLLGESHECMRTTNAVSTLITLGMELPNVIILSHAVLKSSAIESLLHELDQAPNIPNPHIVLLTNTPPEASYSELVLVPPESTPRAIFDALQRALQLSLAGAP